ncbi:MAG: glutamate--tRNA ligase [Ignavibacteriae bacterium]|nr:MAG: glutamate--tRNA ligase [Ignavibacteriota bacterium]
MEEVRVRFAPSPTGFLHVGGARTAIFNWLYARSKKGKFLLRIEDTDAQRSKSELSEQIIRSLDWLEIRPDEPVVYQSDRISRYKEIVEQLVSLKKAYYCFKTIGELDLERKEAQANKTSIKHDRASMNMTDDEIKEFISSGKEYTIRFHVPDGVTEFDDLVHGKTTFSNSGIDDFVILRSDGTPVYQIAVVVDDHDMNITHVIRGDDHLSNTPKQILLYKAMNWELPLFAHLPMILDEDKRKLSKRRNPVAVEEYRDKGYLHEALFNFLTLLGFAPNNNTELISRDELVETFTFARVNKKSAVFDMKKLNWINSEYIKMKDEADIASLVKEGLNKIMPETDAESIPLDYVIKSVHLMKERVCIINDFIELGKYFFIEPETYEEKGLAKYSNDESKKLLAEYLDSFNEVFSDNNIMNPEELEKHLRSYTDLKGVKAASVIHPLRLALTGGTVSPGIFEVMEVLGKDKIRKRIKRFIQ